MGEIICSTISLLWIRWRVYRNRLKLQEPASRWKNGIINLRWSSNSKISDRWRPNRLTSAKKPLNHKRTGIYNSLETSVRWSAIAARLLLAPGLRRPCSNPGWVRRLTPQAGKAARQLHPLRKTVAEGLFQLIRRKCFFPALCALISRIPSRISLSNICSAFDLLDDSRNIWVEYFPLHSCIEGEKPISSSRIWSSNDSSPPCLPETAMPIRSNSRRRIRNHFPCFWRFE